MLIPASQSNIKVNKMKQLMNKSTADVACYSTELGHVYIDNKTGVSGVSKTTLAQMCGVSHQAVASILEGGVKKAKHISDLQAKSVASKQSIAMDNVKIVPDDVAAEVISYYAMAGKKEAMILLQQTCQAGFRALVHNMAGHQITSTAVSQPTPTAVMPFDIEAITGPLNAIQRVLPPNGNNMTSTNHINHAIGRVADLEVGQARIMRQLEHLIKLNTK